MDESFSLKLFLSADLIGSTALKSEAIGVEIEPLWLKPFQDFYTEFPIVFNGQQQKLQCNVIDFWKGIGDELLWVTTLTNTEDAISSLSAFKFSIEEYNQKLSTTGKKVRLKGTAWIAGFPITHRTVPLPDGRFDYIGPYIDSGFRLSKFSSQMRMVISVDLAWFILSCKVDDDEREHLTLRFDGSESMKGVLGGKPYPIIWIKCDSSLEEMEYKLQHRENYPDDWRKSLKKFCEEFIKTTDDKIIFPYIAGENPFGHPHQSYQIWIERKKQSPDDPVDIHDDNQFIDSNDEIADGISDGVRLTKCEW
jgi:hypothetical protein